jgi:hypothetical protein
MIGIDHVDVVRPQEQFGWTIRQGTGGKIERMFVKP